MTADKKEAAEKVIKILAEKDTGEARSDEHVKSLQEFVDVYKPLVDKSPEFAEFVMDTIDSFASIAVELNDMYTNIMTRMEKAELRITGLIKAMEMMNEAISSLADTLTQGEKHVGKTENHIEN